MDEWFGNKLLISLEKIIFIRNNIDIDIITFICNNIKLISSYILTILIGSVLSNVFQISDTYIDNDPLISFL